MEAASTEQPLEYARLATLRGRNPNRPLYLAFVCGMTPALLGTIIIVAWLLTRSHGLELLGFFNILLGIVCTLVGLPALGIYLWQSWHAHRRPLRSWLVPGALAGAILLGNFQLARFYVWVATLYTVDVVNASGSAMGSFIVTDPSGRTWELGPIAAGGKTHRMLDLEGEGAVVFSAKLGGTTVDGEVDGYITSGMENGAKTVTLNADGTFSVR